MTLGLPHVCELWFGVCNGMLPVRHLTPKILVAVNYCGCQLAQKLGWVAPACHKNDGATPPPGTCKRSLQYDGRLDGRFLVWVGTWNFDSLCENAGEICE